MRKVIIIISSIVIALGIIAAVIIGVNLNKNDDVNVGNEDNSANVVSNTTSNKATTSSDYLSGKYNVEIDVKDYGKIDVELDADVAPITVTNFVDLVNQGFYDGLTFHRIISGFMIQGGDPKGTGTGGSGKSIKGEFSENGVKNNISHVRGVISMARSNSYNSGSSQFFIMHEDATYLDGNYAAFGHVTSGMEVVDAIASTAKVEDSNGTVAAANQPVITSIKVID